MASRLVSASNPLLQPKQSSQNLFFSTSNLRPNALGCSTLLLRSVAPPPLLRIRTRRTPTATAVSMVPSSKPERANPNAGVMWSARAIKSFAMAELEARKLKYPTTGTEALLMGILVEGHIEGTSLAAKFLRANGIALFKVREDIVNLLGKSDMYFFSPEHPPVTEPGQRALNWAVEEKLKSGKSGEVTTSHLLLGIWSEENSTGHKILSSYGFDNEKAGKLAKTADKDFELNYR